VGAQLCKMGGVKFQPWGSVAKGNSTVNEMPMFWFVIELSDYGATIVL